MYERFTDRARKVMQLANQEAQRFNHEYIGTEHLLLGLIHEGSGVAANVLKNIGLDLRKVRQEVEKIVLPGPDMVNMGKLPLTPRSKKVIEFAIEEARALNHNYVGTEHLLLGLLRESEGVAAQVLLNLGLTLRDVRIEVLNLLGHPISPMTSNATGPHVVADPQLIVTSDVYKELATQLGHAGLKPRGVKMREFDFCLPTKLPNGTSVETQRVEELRQRLVGFFGSVRQVDPVDKALDDIVIYRVLAKDNAGVRQFLLALKQELSPAYGDGIVIVIRRVEVL